MRALHLAFIAALVAVAVGVAADDWPHWRGPNRDDTTGESSRYPEGAWPPGDPTWTAQVGVGGSSPLVADGHLYAFGWRDGHELVSCLDAETGVVRWNRTYPAPDYGRHHRADESMYRGPSSTPEFDPRTGRLYTLGIDGDLTCRDTRREGTLVWTRNLYDDFDVGQRPDAGGGVRDYGYTSAPLIHEGCLLIEVGASEGNLIAFDPATGEVLWRSDCTDPAGHTGGIVPVTVGGVPCAAALTLHRLLVVRLDEDHEGETMTQLGWQTHYANSIATPTAHGDSLVLTSGYNQSRTARVRLQPGQAQIVWESNRYSKVCSPVVSKGYVYFAWHRLRCLDWETGEELWAGGAYGDDASLIATADGRLIALGRGRLVLVEGAGRARDEYTELAARDDVADGRCWPHVTPADGRVYVRDADGSLACFDLSN